MTHVLVLGGGPDAEREVSLASSSAVAIALRETGYEVTYETLDTFEQVYIDSLPGDVIFPVVHGPLGEGGPLQDILKITGRPYVASESRPSRLAMDKITTKLIAERLEIASYLHRGVRIVFRNKVTGGYHEFKHEGGIRDFLRFGECLKLGNPVPVAIIIEEAAGLVFLEIFCGIRARFIHVALDAGLQSVDPAGKQAGQVHGPVFGIVGDLFLGNLHHFVTFHMGRELVFLISLSAKCEFIMPT